MNLGDAARLLALVQAYDNRKVDELIISAWQQILAPLDFTDACQTVTEHYTRSNTWIMPSDVADGVKRIRADRLARTHDPVPDCDPDDTATWLNQLRTARAAIASGQPVLERLELEGGPVRMPPTWRDEVRASLPPAKPTRPGDPKPLGSCLDPLNERLEELVDQHQTETAGTT